MSSNDNNKKFSFFPYMSESVSSCSSSLDMGYPNSDQERSSQCIGQCQWLCWGPILVVDIVTLPFRGIKHIVLKCKKSKITKTTTDINDIKNNHNKTFN
jgi:hypothetical protein